MKSVAIIILNWNRSALTNQTIESLQKISHRYFSYKIVVVDNASSDDSVAKISSKNPSIKLIVNKTNLGYVGGNNIGISWALSENFDYIMLINNDVVVKPDFLDNLVHFFEHHPDISIVGPKIYFAPGHEYHQKRYHKDDLGKVIWSYGGRMDWNNILGSNIAIDKVDRGQFGQPNYDVDFISGCCLMTKSSVFHQIGLFDEMYFMYLEDVDFCHLATMNGYKLACVPSSIIWHLNAGSSKAGGNLQYYFLTRNRLVFGMRYASPRTKLALIRESIIKILNSNSSWEKQAIIDFYIHRLGRGSWK